MNDVKKAIRLRSLEYIKTDFELMLYSCEAALALASSQAKLSVREIDPKVFRKMEYWTQFHHSIEYNMTLCDSQVSVIAEQCRG